MKDVKNCDICGKPLRLYKKENYDMSELTSYAFSSRKIPEYMHYALYECRDCRILYSHCPIEIQDIFQQYKEAAYDSGQEADHAGLTYFGYLKRQFPNFPKEKALDIGTGNGSFLKILKQGGVKSVIGVEPSVAPINAADEDIRKDIINDVFRTGMFEQDSFDMVSLFQTIEHVPDPLGVISEIHSILKPGGYFYLVCHDYRSLVNRMLGMKSPIYDIEHLQIFSKRSIYRAMKKAGFQEIRVFVLRNKYPLKYWIRLFPFGTKTKERLLVWLEKSRLGQIIISINVGNVGVIAQK